MDESGEVVETNGQNTNSKPAFVQKNAHDPIIDEKLFKKAQKRSRIFSTRKPRHNGYALSGILTCDHCGGVMYACKPKNSAVIYRCSSPARTGNGTCGQYRIREDKILPFILKMLSEEIENLFELTMDAPEELMPQPENRFDRQDEIQKEIDDLEAKIDVSEENLLFVNDSRSRQNMDKRISEIWDQLDKLKAELDSSTSDSSSFFTPNDIEKLIEWRENLKRAIHLPLDPDEYPDAAVYHAA